MFKKKLTDSHDRFSHSCENLSRFSHAVAVPRVENRVTIGEPPNDTGWEGGRECFY